MHGADAGLTSLSRGPSLTLSKLLCASDAASVMSNMTISLAFLAVRGVVEHDIAGVLSAEPGRVRCRVTPTEAAGPVAETIMPILTSARAGRTSAASATNVTTTSRFLVIQDFLDDEGFRVAPGPIVVAAKGDRTIENDVARFHVDTVEFCPLHERAQLMKAADQEIGGAGRLRLSEQLIRIDFAH